MIWLRIECLCSVTAAKGARELTRVYLDWKVTLREVFWWSLGRPLRLSSNKADRRQDPRGPSSWLSTQVWHDRTVKNHSAMRKWCNPSSKCRRKRSKAASAILRALRIQGYQRARHWYLRDPLPLWDRNRWASGQLSLYCRSSWHFLAWCLCGWYRTAEGTRQQARVAE
jgi:hypothetical protein